jgi:uroporphyrinogen-III decarboxylase
MNPREIVKAAVEFKNPPRAPRQLWVLPWAATHYPQELNQIRERFPDDIVGAPAIYKTPLPKTQGDPYEEGTYVDEWGCIFKSVQAGVIGEVKEPVLKELADMDQMRLPVEFLSFDIDAVNAFCRSTDRFVTSGCCARPFERMQFLRSTVNLYYDMLEAPAKFEALLDKVNGFFMEELEMWAKTEVDALNFMDDWGAQRALLISPAMWRKYFKPVYKAYADLAHRHGKYLFFHSDGYIQDILPDLVEIGVDAVNCQLFVMDIEEIGRSLRGKITFWGEIDRQHLLPTGSKADIAAAVRRVYENLYDRGGAIAQCEFGAGARPENVYQVYQTWEEIFKP